MAAVLVGTYLLGMGVYSAMQGPIESAAAVRQLSDNAVEYSASRAVATGLIPKVATGVLAISLLGLMLWPRRRNGTAMSLVLLAIAASMSGACRGPYQVEVVKEIGPNETAFLVPLEGASKDAQGKFMSVEYLNANKVATKRVTIPTRRHDLDRGFGNYEWIETMKLITVDRTPVTRVWTKRHDTGTSKSDESFCVESVESIDFCAGATAIATITEDDAAKYQYNYAGKKLADAMDQDVRGAVGIFLAREFGNRKLDDGRKAKSEIFATAYKEVAGFFALRGITLLQLGSTEGLQYVDQNIQAAINATFVAENDKNTAENQRVAQAKRNELNVAMATAQRQAAEEFARAKDAQVAKIQLDIDKIRAEAMYEAAKRWNGTPPASILPQGSTLFFGLDQPLKK